LNAPFVSWSVDGTGASPIWLAQTNIFRVDGLAGESGLVEDDEEVWIEVKTVGVTNVSFWWRTSSELKFDGLRFFINQIDAFGVTNITGVMTNWQFQSFPLNPVGTNLLRWSYYKDFSDFDGEDKGWVDEITFQPFALTIPQRLPNGTAQFNLNFGAGWPCRVLVSTNLSGGSWTQLLSTNTTTNVTTVLDPGAATSPHRFYRAVAP
jgi:hypothetical protein